MKLVFSMPPHSIATFLNKNDISINPDTVKSIKGVCGDFGFDLPALSVMYLKPVD